MQNSRVWGGCREGVRRVCGGVERGEDSLL
jgi:hypothetical protein